MDTESAAPFDYRMLGRRHESFPILQYSYVRCSYTFQQRLSSGTNYVFYPDKYNLGNDENSSVLKFPIKLLECGIDVNDALYALYKQLERVVETGGCVIAHNVRHDMAQL